MRRRALLMSMASASVMLWCQTGSAATAVRRRPAKPPLLVTGDVDDPHFTQPYIDVEEWRDVPAAPVGQTAYTTQSLDPAYQKVRHLFVHGGFKGTDTKFTFSFPPPEQYQGRFYQQTHQLTSDETPPPRNVAMCIASGAYCVQTNMGGSEMARTAEDNMKLDYDGHLGSYRVNAAAAKYSRVVAQRIYGRQHRPFGYLYGGSGGAYQLTSSAQNTKGVWDGFLPYVMGNPATTTAHFMVRAHALRVLKDKWPAVIDAFEPGGGDPYATLNAEQRVALEEATLLGMPPRAWHNYVPRGTGPMGYTAAYVPILDPAYFEDFWSKPGYIAPSSTVKAQRLQAEAKVVRVIPNGAAPTGRNVTRTQLELSTVPAGDLVYADLIGVTGEGKGQSAPLGPIDGNVISFGLGANPNIVNRFKVGDTVRFDNSNYLALQTYYRHAMPERGSAFDFPAVFDSFRNADGSPKYPQRDINVSLGEGFGDVGVTHGAINGKMIVVQTMLDGDAFPEGAAWYERLVRAAMGPKYEDTYRIWYNDNAEHVTPSTPSDLTHTVSYLGILDQALRDLSAWAEKGVAPPPSSSYKVVKGQVQLPPDAKSRKGIQPVVDLKVNGGIVAKVAAGKPVIFTAKVDLPPNTGSIVAADWDPEGTGTYPNAAELKNTTSSSVTVTSTHTYEKPGTYFAAIRATSNRQGDAKTPFWRIPNLGRVRVIVT